MATNEQAPPAPAPAGSGEYTHAQILTILSGLMLGMFLGALDQTIVSTSIRTIADDLNGLSVQAWVTTAYLISATLTTPIYGKLGDLFGRKQLFMFAISVFIAGSALCSFASSMYELAAFRAVQGIGAGGLFTLVLAIIGDIVSPRERAKYTGYFMAVFGTSSVLGPVIGGFFAGREELLGIHGWRWVFLVNVPIGIAALAVVSRTLHIHPVPRHGRIRIDWWGTAALCIGLVPLLTVAEQGRSWGWGSGRSVSAYGVGALGLVAFFLIEWAMRDDALIPLKLFRIRPAAITLVASVIVGAAMFGGIMILPLYMQIVHGASPTQSGFLMLPMVVGMMTGSIVGGRVISRTGHIRAFPIAGSALVVVGLMLLSFSTADTPLWVVMIPMVVLGLGLGNSMQPLLLIVQSSVPPTSIGVATSSATFFRQIGGTLGVAVFLSILFSSVGANIADRVREDAQTQQWQQVAASADPSSLDGQVVASLTGHAGPGGGVLAKVQDDSSIIEQMNPVLAHSFKAGFSDSMDVVFRSASVVAVFAFLVLLLMPKVELRATSAQAAARAQASQPAPPVDLEI
jgi:EmrB/QacA subfamily drug resistance transporter